MDCRAVAGEKKTNGRTEKQLNYTSISAFCNPAGRRGSPADAARGAMADGLERRNAAEDKIDM
jgi:hypothetical protein